MPLGYAAGPGDAFELWGEVVATVRDVRIVSPPAGSAPAPETYQTDEQLVEGHSVYAVLDIRREVVPPEEGNVTISGLVECHHDGKISTVSWEPIPGLVIPLPTRVDSVDVRCRVGETVVVVPDPFSQGASSGSVSPLVPTGDVLIYDTPLGVRTYAEELTFTLERLDARGRPETKAFTAWRVPILDPWVDAEGRLQNFLLPMPVRRVAENDARGYEALLES
ncbi:MAG TPA: hypothetical protein VHH36_06510 [Candidatus Thermoplasmatota archaeon]|nr:hypothetical protein [Candidatus Thermoplasmatota archaeon]